MSDYEQFVDCLSEGVAIFGNDGRVISVNSAYLAITGRKTADVVGHPLPVLKPDTLVSVRRDGIVRYTCTGSRTSDHNGESAPQDVNCRVSVTRIDGGQFVAVLDDRVTPLTPLNLDPLTQLPGRALFMDRLEQSIPVANRTRTHIGVLAIGFDSFRHINEDFGKEAGDWILIEAGKRLSGLVRSGDTVARLAGDSDSFAVLLANVTEARFILELAQRMQESLEAEYRIPRAHAGGGVASQDIFTPVPVSATIGAVVHSGADGAAEAKAGGNGKGEMAKQASALAENAISALKTAKKRSQGSVRFFTHDLNQAARGKEMLRRALRGAVGRGEISLYFQPKMDVATGQIRGAEALMRWRNSELGNVSPVQFIPVLEESNMILDTGNWAIKTVCEVQHRLQRLRLPPMRLAVNVSERELREDGFVSHFTDILHQHSIDPASIEVEITERSLVSENGPSRDAIVQLHDAGIHIAMDDFGTGYSSLSYLRLFPIDTIKVDKAFVTDVTESDGDADLLRTIVAMGQALKRRVVAEGVETQTQKDILEAFGCDEIQGFVLSEPLQTEMFFQFLQANSR